MITINDIARLAGVSKSTVSRVVSGTGSVRPKTREKIEAVMREHNYVPNLFAKGMRTNKSYSIGILFPDFTNPYLYEWYQIVDRIAREKGYLNYICITDPKGETEEKRIDDLLARSIDGIVLFSYCLRGQMVNKLLKVSKHTPVICSDSMFQHTGLSCVFADGEQGTFDAVNHLIKQGRKRIAYIKGEDPYTVVELRYSGYKKALQENGMKLNETLVFSGDFKKESGYEAAKLLMNRINRPDAIVSSTDDMALGALEYLLEHNIDVPGEVAVMGFNNQMTTRNTMPKLSTVSIPVVDMAKTAINTLVDMIETQNTNTIIHKFNCQLELREST